MCSSDTLPLEGRYHDGHVRCDDGNATGHNCRGFMEATYTSDGVHASNVTFFEYYQSNTDPPFVHVNRNSSAGESVQRAQGYEVSLQNLCLSVSVSLGLLSLCALYFAFLSLGCVDL